jgi:hypothetical protein
MRNLAYVIAGVIVMSALFACAVSMANFLSHVAHTISNRGGW